MSTSISFFSQGEWKGESAAGIKDSSSINKLPQFGLNVPRRCRAVVVLESFTLKDRNFGKYNIGFKILKSGKCKSRESEIKMASFFFFTYFYFL